MKTIKELINEKFSVTFSSGYNQCREDVLGLIDELQVYTNKTEWDALEELKKRIIG